MSDHLPSFPQVAEAEKYLLVAHTHAVGISFYAVACKEETSVSNVFRRALLSSLRQAARHLGYDLVPRAGPVLAIDNTNHAEGPR